MHIRECVCVCVCVCVYVCIYIYIYIYIYIPHHHKFALIAKNSQHSCPSLMASPQDCTQCPHTADLRKVLADWSTLALSCASFNKRTSL